MNKVLIGFCAGLLTGLLFAPAKGSETRETISSRGRDLKNKFNDLVDSLADKFDSMKDDVDEFAGTRQRADSFKNEMI
jgi:gas vesicle protein